MPGLIDAHYHMTDYAYLTTMRKHGITTALDMGTFQYSADVACKATGVIDIKHVSSTNILVVTRDFSPF